ncbi:MAG: hypothetical protein KA352_15985 [Flavobacteriales bacterium]|nr:hypothetical protein [Flavobacteriales bacterium]
MKRHITVLILTGVVVLCSCRNRYEEQLVGVYSVAAMKLDSGATGYDVKLSLSNSRLFELNVNGKLSSGSWEAGDDGDHTWIEFIGSTQAQGFVGGPKLELIDLLIPSSFCCPGVTELILARDSLAL